MKKIILSAVLGTAALGIAAVVGDPAATPTDGSTVSVGPDGVEADIDAGDARVRTDGDGTTTVTTD